MRKSLFLVTLAAVVSLALSSCKGFKGAEITCSPEAIEVHADSVKYTIKASVPAKSGMKKGGTYIGEAKVGGVSQGKVVFSTDRYPNVKKTGIDTTIKFARPYVEKMNGNTVVIKQSYERKGKEFELPDIENLCKCCITTPYWINEGNHYIFSTHKYEKEVPIRLEAKFNFPKNVDEIQPGDYNKSDIKAIGDFLTKKYPATSITVQGFASPEGPYKRNVELSTNRSKQVQDWLTEQLKAQGYENYLDSNFFKITVTHEDWDKFKADIQNQPFSDGVKKQIISLVSAGLEPNKLESEVMALVGGKEKVEYILAPLRRATIVVEGFEARKTDAEIDKIAEDFAAGNFKGNLKDTFEKEEWMYAVGRQRRLSTKKALLEAFRDAYPSDARAFNDLGVIAMKQNDADAGMNYLEKAYKLNTNDYAILNNIGAAYTKKGKYKDAKEVLEKSVSARNTPEANFNLGVVYEKMARYNRAVEKFNNAGDLEDAAFNAGLCKLLMGDVNGAKASLGKATKEDPNAASPFYVMAVAGARSGDISTCLSNLKQAIDLDGNLKAKARGDLEFMKYFNNSEFKTLVK